MELIRKVDFRSHILEVYDQHKTDKDGKSVLAYRFYPFHEPEKMLFTGDDFHMTPLYADDSDHAVRHIMTFVTLRPGDTDKEYFAGYNDKQLEFCSTYAEALGVYVFPDEPLELIDCTDCPHCGS